MAITTTYDPNKAFSELIAQKEVEFNVLIEQLKSVANAFYEDAYNQPEGHDKGFYNNITFRLRKSIAVYILRNGMIVWSKENDNIAENRSFISRFSNSGITIIGMVGMYYARYVEAKGYNVISMQGKRYIIDLSAQLFLKFSKSTSLSGLVTTYGKL